MESIHLRVCQYRIACADPTLSLSPPPPHTGADIKAVCTEAGLLALRERRMRVTQEDFVKAKEKTLYRKKGNIPEGLYL
jgi:ATP-dependent 26S proteasome regulatory subunit